MRRRAAGIRPALAPVLFILLAACAPRLAGPGPDIRTPELTRDAVITADDARLALKVWPARPDGAAPKAVIVALHGFNDYSNFVAAPAAFLAARGYAVYAYDQRGFGTSPNVGLWAGEEAMIGDLRTVARLVKARHPGTPFYLLGASMGGAVIMVAMTGDDPPEADGIILSGPAVWARATQPFYQRWALWLAAHTVPWLKLTGEGLNIKPSDNIEMLRALGRDALVIKETRVDSIYGLNNLMDRALAASAKLDGRALILIGRNDEIIPAKPSRRMIANLPERGKDTRVLAYYEAGYHMLLRDLQREVVWRDIAAWMADPAAALPSGADKKTAALISGQ